MPLSLTANLNSVAPLDTNQVETMILDSITTLENKMILFFDAKLSALVPHVKQHNSSGPSLTATSLGVHASAGLTGVQPTTIRDSEIHFKHQSWENPYATAAPTENDSSKSNNHSSSYSISDSSSTAQGTSAAPEKNRQRQRQLLQQQR